MAGPVELVTLEAARIQLNTTDPARDADIIQKIQIASAIVLTFCKKPQVMPVEWIIGSPVTTVVPMDVQGVVLAMVAEMFLNRESSISNAMSKFMEGHLRFYRRSTLA